MLILLVIFFFFVLFVFVILDSNYFGLLPDNVLSVGGSLSFVAFLLSSLLLAEVCFGLSEQETIEKYNNLINYYEMCEQTDTVDYVFYQDIIAWNEFVEEQHALTESIWCRDFVPGWFANLEYIEVPDVTIVQHNYSYEDFVSLQGDN